MLDIRFHRFGSPSELRLENLPNPILQADEVLVKIQGVKVLVLF